MMGAAALSWLVGLALLAGLIGYQGASDVVTALGLVGWGALLLGLVHLCTLLADTLGWRALLRRPARPALPMLLLGRWVGMSVNGLLPVAQVGGEWVRAGLLRRAGVPGPVAGASVVIDLTIGVVTQVAFVALGLALLAARPDQGAGISELIIGIGLLGVMAASFGILQQRGLFGWSGRLLERLGRHGARTGIAGDALALDQEVRRCYRRLRALAICAGWRLLAWLTGTVELWLAFTVLGRPIDWVEAVILESVGQAARSAGFMIPGGLGVQEGGMIAAGAWVGVPTEVALAVGLLKRARELAYGVPGLLVWPLIRTRSRRATAVTEIG